LQALLIGALVNPLPLMLLVLAQSLFNLLWSYLVNALYLRLYPPVKTMILYHRESELLKLRQVKDFSMKFDVRQCRKDPADNPLLFQELEEHAAVFLLGIDLELRSKIAEYCLKSKRKAYIVPSASDIVLTGAKLLDSYPIPIYRVGRSSPTPEYAVLKRLFDVVLSFVGIVLASPVMLVTALAIKLTDGGPVFYRQQRLTRNGACFNIWKFRSMRVDAEQDGVARLACEHDRRITPVGKIIRSTRIDELPQLFNILRGHMSLVGPRPERPEIAAEYEKSIPAFSLRLQVKAGLTGYAQVYGRYDSAPQDKLNMDLMYINNTSILEDIRLLFATLKILFLEESTTGLKDGQMHAMQEEEEEWMKRDSA
jgi:exopolysaccharide biosynthesis polyprenyl glycosylphosphotransferase